MFVVLPLVSALSRYVCAASSVAVTVVQGCYYRLFKVASSASVAPKLFPFTPSTRWGLLNLTGHEYELVKGDSTTWLRFLFLYAVAQASADQPQGGTLLTGVGNGEDFQGNQGDSANSLKKLPLRHQALQRIFGTQWK